MTLNVYLIWQRVGRGKPTLHLATQDPRVARDQFASACALEQTSRRYCRDSLRSCEKKAKKKTFVLKRIAVQCTPADWKP